MEFWNIFHYVLFFYHTCIGPLALDLLNVIVKAYITVYSFHFFLIPLWIYQTREKYRIYTRLLLWRYAYKSPCMQICISSIFPEGHNVSLSISHAADSIGLKEIPKYEVRVGEQYDWIKKTQVDLLLCPFLLVI